jgi:topoisomerase IA-like protein
MGVLVRAGELESDDLDALEDTGQKFPGIVVGVDPETGEAIYPRHQEEDAG